MRRARMAATRSCNSHPATSWPSPCAPALRRLRAPPLVGPLGRIAVLREERSVRLRAVRPFVHAMAGLPEAGIPTFVVGDLNSPSHEDWIEATVDLRPQIRFGSARPVTRFLARNGFVDAWRVVHPDPPRTRASPGPPRVLGRTRAGTPVATPCTTASTRSGLPAQPPRSRATSWLNRRGPGVGISVRPWGSDHRAVVSTFDVTPGTPPVMVSPATGWSRSVRRST